LKMARFFKKLYTLHKETLEDDFIDLTKEIGSNLNLKLITNFKHEHGVNLKVTAKKHPNGNVVEGLLEPEVKYNNFVLKGKIPTSNEFETTILANDILTKGATVFVTGKCNVEASSVKSSVEVGVDYLQKDLGSVNLKVITPTPVETNDIKVYGAITGHSNGVSVGVEGTVGNFEKGAKLEKWTGYIQHDSEGQSVALFGKNTGKEVSAGVGYYKVLNDTFSTAVEVSADPSDVSKNVVKVGAVVKIDANSTVKERIHIQNGHNFRYASVYKQNLSSCAKLTFLTDFNLNHLISAPGKDDKSLGNHFGVSLTFFD